MQLRNFADEYKKSLPTGIYKETLQQLTEGITAAAKSGKYEYLYWIHPCDDYRETRIDAVKAVGVPYEVEILHAEQYRFKW